MSDDSENDPTIRVGISSCLIGEQVRWDGSHTRDHYITDTLGSYVEWISVCPEEEAGMGVPREKMVLQGNPEDPRILGRESGEDWTEELKKHTRNRLEELREKQLHGFILKSNSPSCGKQDVTVQRDARHEASTAPGIFARELLSEMSLLPVVEDQQLQNPDQRESFIDGMYAYYRWNQLIQNDPDPGDLVEFHTSQKMNLLAHDQNIYRELGPIVGNLDKGTFQDTLNTYGEKFMNAMFQKTTRGNHVNVLTHLQGFLKDYLSREELQHLMNTIGQYRNGAVPLLVPITLLKYHFQNHPVDWIMKQSYLFPFPTEVHLQNHA